MFVYLLRRDYRAGGCVPCANVDACFSSRERVVAPTSCETIILGRESKKKITFHLTVLHKGVVTDHNDPSALFKIQLDSYIYILSAQNCVTYESNSFRACLCGFTSFGFF